MFRVIFIVIFTLLCLTFLTGAVQRSYIGCDKPWNSSNIQSVSITDCDIPPCILKKRTNVNVEQVFTVNRDIKKLVTVVFAKILSFDFPFIGVSGTSACEQIYNMDDTLAGCSLKAGGVYKYKNSFPILLLYPNVATDVTWKLVEDKNDVTCFKVKAKITP